MMLRHKSGISRSYGGVRTMAVLNPPPAIITTIKPHTTMPVMSIAITPQTAASRFGLGKKAPELSDGKMWTYSDFITAVQEHKIDYVTIDERAKKLSVVATDGKNGTVAISNTNKDYLQVLMDNDVSVQYKTADDIIFLQYVGMIVEYGVTGLIGFMMLYYIVMMIRNNASGGGGASASGPFQFLKSNAKFNEKPDTNVKFEDVAGLEGAKQELYEIVDFLKNPEKYSIVGAKIPKGCLLVGPPGTGKTLLARAIAGEAGVPFFSCAASEFVELFAGVGASRIRSLFKDAVAKAPCIIFIDEIDAVGKKRSNGVGGFGGGNDEREQTINQLLTEMDGFAGNTGVIVIAATNRVEILDEALLRPGRFDRQISIDLPDVRGRKNILMVHTRNKPLESDINLESYAKITAGFSGADLEMLCNEAAILAARNNREKIIREDFDAAIERIQLGIEKKHSIISKEKKWLTAIHEAGHAIVGVLIGDFDDVRKVTIIPRGGAGGVTYFEPAADRVDSGLVSRKYLENQLSVALGGRIAEELFFGEENATTGASGDIERVQQIARMMVTRYGFSNKMGPIAWTQQSPISPLSETTMQDIDQEIKRLVAAAYARARMLLLKNKDSVRSLAEALMQKETLTGDDVQEILRHSCATLPPASEAESAGIAVLDMHKN